MDSTQLEDVFLVAQEEERRRQWSQDTELLATAVDALMHIAARLDAGIATVTPQRGIGKPVKNDPVTRPDWVKPAAPQIPAMSPRDVFAMFRKG